MPYTFGAGTGDDINWAMGMTMGATARLHLVCGWWYPTTLTDTRGLWSAGNVYGAEINTTTSELRLRTDNTTDGQWTTTGAALAVNKWSFLAFASSQSNTGPAAAWRVWMGTLDEAPIEITVTSAVAPVGNFTGNATFYIGNKGTGTLAFQGDIANLGYYVSQAAVGDDFNPFTLAAYGAISVADGEWIKERFVDPYYRGLGWCMQGGPRRFFGSASNLDECAFIHLDHAVEVAQIYRNGVAATAPSATIVNTGATPSRNGAPLPLRVQSPIMPPKMLGR